MHHLIEVLAVVTAFSCSLARNGLAENAVVTHESTLPSSGQSSGTREFLHALRDCWSFKSEDCIPTMPRRKMDNVNVVRAIKGTSKEH